MFYYNWVIPGDMFLILSWPEDGRLTAETCRQVNYYYYYYYYLLQLGCHPVAVVILHVYKT